MAASRARRAYDRKYDLAALDRLRAMGVNLIPVTLPDLPYGAMTSLLTAEAAAAFDELTITGRDKLLTEQGIEDWPNDFRIARFYPAVEYIQANRARTLAIRAGVRSSSSRSMSSSPPQTASSSSPPISPDIPPSSFPTACAVTTRPHRLKIDTGDDDQIGGPGTPVSITFLAGHYQDAKLCAFARAYQEATGFQKLHPKLS